MSSSRFGHNYGVSQPSRAGDVITEGAGTPRRGVAHTQACASTLLTAPGVVATDLDTEHGGTDANKRDGRDSLAGLNIDDLQL
jgi:hypothetical protein